MNDSLIIRLQGCSRQLKLGFAITERRKWTAEAFCLELAAQYGHFTFALAAENLSYNRPMILSDISIKDELCDVFFQIFNLANLYSIELANEVKEFHLEQVLGNICTLSTITEGFSNSIGILCDCILRQKSYKDYGGQNNSQLSELIRMQISILFSLAIQLSIILEIEIEESFMKMVADASAYLEEWKDHDKHEE